jgi:hypothetical protein
MKQIIHIGGNKTASSLLQRQLFKKDTRIQYLGEESSSNSQDIELLSTLINCDDSFYSEELTRSWFLAQSCDQDPEIFLFSSEDIMTSLSPSVCAQRLNRLLPDAEIVMVIRNQLTAWPSWYANHGTFLKNVPRRYWKSYVSFKDWLEYCFSFPKQSPVEAMNYYRFYKIFTSIFGKNRVHIILYEDLIENPETFYQTWAQLLNFETEEVTYMLSKKSERPRISNRYLKLHRLTGLFPSLTSSLAKVISPWIHQGKKASVPISKNHNTLISNYYSQSNAALSKEIGIDLSQYGYPIPNNSKL